MIRQHVRDRLLLAVFVALPVAVAFGACGCQDRRSGGAGATTEKRAEPDRRPVAAIALPQTSRAQYLGQTVDFYGPGLLDLDPSTSLAAAGNLEHLGAESLRWFYKGLTSGTPHVVDYSVSYMPGEDAQPYLELFEPLLLPMLDSKNQIRRSQSAVKLVQMKSAKGAKRMRELIESPTTSKHDADHFRLLIQQNGL